MMINGINDMNRNLSVNVAGVDTQDIRAISIATSICRLLMLLREALNSLSVMKLKSLIRATAYTCLLA